MKISFALLFLLLIFNQTFGQIGNKLSNPKASKQAKALYAYLTDMYGKKILSGQMWASWGFDELKYIQEITGKQPAIRGMDYIHAKENDKETQRAIDWWKLGGIPTIMWHSGAPSLGEGFKNSQKEIDIDKCFQEGTPEYQSFWQELSNIADQLEKLKKAKVPILWRPYHELNGNWFWWGKKGPEQFKRLWITTYKYFVEERKLNNLIWVLCYNGKPDSAWYPGNQYVDIAGADTYGVGDDPQSPMYSKLKTSVDKVMPLSYHECGTPPDPLKCLEQGTMWSWWMEWHTDHLAKVDKEYLKCVYNHDLVITRDEIPDIVKLYRRK